MGGVVEVLLVIAFVAIPMLARHDMNSPGAKHIARSNLGTCDSLERSRIPAWKRVLDCSLVILSAPLWMPVGMMLAVFVKIVSPGPAIFRQERIGHQGARFRCLKFRTMHVNAGNTVHQQHLHHLMASNRPMKKLDNTGDSRLIPGGLWLRTLGLDELPQFFNVLRGEMSLVGPRPATAMSMRCFSRAIAGVARRSPA